VSVYIYVLSNYFAIFESADVCGLGLHFNLRNYLFAGRICPWHLLSKNVGVLFAIVIAELFVQLS